MQLERFGVTPELPQGRVAFRFGNQKINLHMKGAEFEPKAHLPVPGALDLCFIAALPLEAVIDRLQAAGVRIEAGPGPRTGATGRIRSVSNTGLSPLRPPYCAPERGVSQCWLAPVPSPQMPWPHSLNT